MLPSDFVLLCAQRSISIFVCRVLASYSGSHVDCCLLMCFMIVLRDCCLYGHSTNTTVFTRSASRGSLRSAIPTCMGVRLDTVRSGVLVRVPF